MVTASAGVQTDLPKVVHTICRLICHSSEPQTSTVRISCPRPKCLGHRCSEHKLDGSHCLFLPSDGSPSQGDPKDQAMPLPDHRNSPRLARDALVLGPSAALNRDPTATSSVNNSSQAVPQSSQPPYLVSRSGQLQEQGFSVEVAERIAAPQRSSTRTINKDHLQVQVDSISKWSRKNLVDFENAPPFENASPPGAFIRINTVYVELREFCIISFSVPLYAGVEVIRCWPNYGWDVLNIIRTYQSDKVCEKVFLPSTFISTLHGRIMVWMF